MQYVAEYGSEQQSVLPQRSIAGARISTGEREDETA
jgi:hypothetical protein